MSEPRIRLPLRIPPSLKAKLTELAERQHRSLNKQIEFMLEWAIQAGPTEGPRGSLRSKAEHVKRK
jgi:hypothetical protein